MDHPSAIVNPAEPVRTAEQRQSLGPKRLAIPAAEAARICGVSLAHWWKLVSSARCPEPLRLGRKCLWRVAELRAWIEAGCPPRSRWKAEQCRRESRHYLDSLPKVQ